MVGFLVWWLASARPSIAEDEALAVALAQSDSLLLQAIGSVRGEG